MFVLLKCGLLLQPQLLQRVSAYCRNRQMLMFSKHPWLPCRRIRQDNEACTNLCQQLHHAFITSLQPVRIALWAGL